MIRHFLLSCVLFLVTVAIAFGQFTHEFHYGVPLKGKIDSVILTHYGFYNFKRSDALTRQLTWKSIFIYNKKGQLIESNEYRSEGALSREPLRFFYHYDDKGNFIQTGPKDRKELYEYVPDGSQVRIKYYYNNQISDVDTIKLDKSGKIIERDGGTPGDTAILNSYYKYNNKGLLNEEIDIFSYRKSDIQKKSYTYDKNGNMSKMINENRGKTSAITYTYDKFDKKHNWLIGNSYREGKLDGVTERQIIYYK